MSKGGNSRRRNRQVEIQEGKTQPLRAQEVRHAHLKRHVALALDRFQGATSKGRDELSILDIGCGRGMTVALLRRDGWDAFGAEIDPAQADLARSSMSAVGGAPAFIVDMTPDGSICVDGGKFDFVISEQVIEHVADLQLFVEETWRVLKPGGAGFHVFPSRRRMLEPHVRQPFVHWLPKGRWQSAAVRLWVALGIEAGFIRLEGLAADERAREYAQYLVERTHYRSRREIETAFLRHFETLDHDLVGDSIAQVRGFSGPMRLPIVKRLIQELCVRSYSSAIYVTKGV